LLSAAGQPRISFDDFSALLFSPWLKGFEAERIERARLDAAFREQNRHRLSWPALLKSSAVQKLPLLASVINVLAEWKTTSRPPNDWVKAVHGLLRTTGFIATGDEDEARRNNMEIRQMNAFRDVLSSLVASDAVMGRLSWVRFLSLLRAGCSEHLLAGTPKYPNVIVMPLAGIAGLRFDHVFVTGLDEEAFPPPVRPLPLLPPLLQQKHGLPMSSGSLAFDSSNWLWHQLLRAAPVVEISYARQKDGRALRPSSFVADLEASVPIEASATVTHPELESFDDAPDVPMQPEEVIRGGTAIIKSQSACPFRAFAAHRLGISVLGETSPGIEPATKGSLIHQALEFIWQRLATQQALLALDEAERSALIDAAIAHAWKENRSSPDFDIQKLEKKRMRGVLNDWLNIETARPNFEVLETEAEYGLPLPGKASRQITLNIKVDRLDKDTMGHRILIDYKTGKKQSSSKWLGERMEEPQLPLYAVAANVGGNDAVVLASVRSGDMGFEGLAAEDFGISGLAACDGKRGRPDDWRKVLDDWKLHINALASEFVDGRCDVSPRDAHACKYCTLKALCRVEESGHDIDAGKDTNTLINKGVST
ncbi:MAG: PD-(D/E)XK nuclease family protein, partial [Mariprofundaceae bacterium]